MFVLVKAPNGVLSGMCEAKAYETYDLAYMAMVREVEEVAAFEGHSPTYDEDGEILDEGRPGDWGIEPDHGFVGACDGPEWHIFEV